MMGTEKKRKILVQNYCVFFGSGSLSYAFHKNKTLMNNIRKYKSTTLSFDNLSKFIHKSDNIIGVNITAI